MISFLALSLLTTINIAYTGCAIYPIKQSCFFEKLSWTIKKEHVEHLSQWYEVWSKAGAGPNHGVENHEEYIQKFNWVNNWYEKYFEYKGLETLGGIFILLILLLIIFYSKNIKPPDKRPASDRSCGHLIGSSGHLIVQGADDCLSLPVARVDKASRS